MHATDNEVKAKRLLLPSAELTSTAYFLAPVDFQFLVIFVSWFGMSLGPATFRRGTWRDGKY